MALEVKYNSTGVFYNKTKYAWSKSCTEKLVNRPWLQSAGEGNKWACDIDETPAPFIANTRPPN